MKEFYEVSKGVSHFRFIAVFIPPPHSKMIDIEEFIALA
jgi:hypothetical protein